MLSRHITCVKVQWRNFTVCLHNLSMVAPRNPSMPRKRPADDLYNDGGSTEVKKSPFQKEYKYYKSRERKPDLSKVIDFCRPDRFPLVKPIPNNELDHTQLPDFDALGLRKLSEWKMYTIEGKDGFYFICNPFTQSGQRTWIRRSVQVYPREPARTNMGSDLWSSEGLPVPELRWCTFGYHHNWATKVYSRDDYSEFPACLQSLCRQLALPFGFQRFEPEAAILHFYRLKSTLGGHIDHSEYDQKAPLLSVSFGQSAVYLLGAEAKEERPEPLFIRSGDVVIMSRSCRFANHAIPLIVADDAYLERCGSQVDEDSSWKPISDYLRTKRVNLNVRQVFPN